MGGDSAKLARSAADRPPGSPVVPGSAAAASGGSAREANGEAHPGGPEEVLPSSRWSQLWQGPAIIGSLLLIGLGLYTAARPEPGNDLEASLAQVEQLIAGGEFDSARHQLQSAIEPAISTATSGQRARFHVAVADWIAGSQEARSTKTRANNESIVENYREADSLGFSFAPVQLERWGQALLGLGKVDAAGERLAQLDALRVTDLHGADATVRHQQLLRKLVEFSLERKGGAQDVSAMMAVLDDYRSQPDLSPANKAWAIARQAELRLRSGAARDTVDHLLIDMRRLEDARPAVGSSTWGELYTLLGRGYLDLGAYDDAAFNLQEAKSRLEPANPIYGDVLLAEGRVLQTRGEFEDAHSRFDEVVKNYPGTSAAMPALFLRAEVASLLGRHDDALTDFDALIGAFARNADGAAGGGISPRAVAASLIDRQHAAITLGDLPLAFAYVSRAEKLFLSGSVPIDVLLGIASTSRQIADDLIDDARKSRGDEPTSTLNEVPAAVRQEANAHYRRAGKYYLRHARTLATLPGTGEDDGWAESLWLAGDSNDLGGKLEPPEGAIAQFREYVDGRSADDPRRAEIAFRLAQALHAQRNYEAAAGYYEQVIADHPRSTFGTQSHVPLARCYAALGRRTEAERQLRELVDGWEAGPEPLTPAAADYREALIELGRIYYENGDHANAIERLTAAAERYPTSPQINEIRSMLADSYRLAALSIQASLDGVTAEAVGSSTIQSGPMLPPSERAMLRERARAGLTHALELFSDVAAGYAAIDPHRLSPLQRTFEREAWMYRGDCAFALGDFPTAIKLYDEHARRYSDHASSVHALVQIVNCYERMNDSEHAAIAHRNALTRLNQLPSSAFDDPQSMLNRSAWEQWLRRRPLGLALGSTNADE